MMCDKRDSSPKNENSVIIYSPSSRSKPNLVSYKYVPLCTFCVTLFYVPYCTFRLSFTGKCPLSGAKAQVKYMIPGTFYYVDIGTYCCVFNTLLQKRIEAVQNSNIWGLSLKVNALSCWKYALHQTQP